ncbi:MAG TPA: NUMOD4 motif-containing HNH endonuclease [Phycisphaerae bacterium]|nr:NUMOD4 motif-containing HNH endonuclease [Phycisphaerae bacterium]
MSEAIEVGREQWKPIVGLEDWYEVSSHGRLRRVHVGPATYVGREVRPYIHKSGYLNVSLSRHGERLRRPIHLIVADAFLCPRPEGHEINHKDGCKLNNHIDNLEWVTPHENQRHAFALGLRSLSHLVPFCRGFDPRRRPEGKIVDNGWRNRHRDGLGRFC